MRFLLKVPDLSAIMRSLKSITRGVVRTWEVLKVHSGSSTDPSAVVTSHSSNVLRDIPRKTVATLGVGVCVCGGVILGVSRE